MFFLACLPAVAARVACVQAPLHFSPFSPSFAEVVLSYVCFVGSSGMTFCGLNFRDCMLLLPCKSVPDKAYCLGP